jgi:hypothetical protein
MTILIFTFTIIISQINCVPISNNTKILSDYELNYIKTMKEKKKFQIYLENARKTFGTCSLLKSYSDKKVSNDGKCVDPNEEEMMINLVRLTLTFKELSGVLDLYSVQEIYKDLIQNKKPKINSSQKNGESNCAKPQLLNNLTQINEISICPWHTHVISRHNLYPSVISNAVCNCDNCQKINIEKEDVEYKCRPVYKFSPALIRNENCNPNIGIYEWTPMLEKISVACVCANTTPRMYFP